MPITFVAKGANDGSSSAIVPGLPAGLVAGDILLLPIETANQASSIANQNGGTWAEIGNVGQGTPAAAGGVRLTVFWSRYNGTQGDPTSNDSGDHQCGYILAYRGCVASGDPWNVTASGNQAADTAGSIPGGTTTIDGCMVVAISAIDRDTNSTNNASSWANASLASITERGDFTTAATSGGGVVCADGIKTSAGLVSATTFTQAASTAMSHMMIALKPLGSAPTGSGASADNRIGGQGAIRHSPTVNR